MHFQPLIKWYHTIKRDLPWRNTSNPYLIWISEVILQQTRVEQGTSYYLNIVKKYPDISSLSKADSNEFMKLWQGLGYYRRAENLLSAARFINQELKGNLPTTYEEWLKIKGIGPYTAAAISSIAYGESRAVLDGNVLRVLSRLFALPHDIDSHKGKIAFTELANQLITGYNPSLFNQALMELGALICKPRNPLCDICPMNKQCQSLMQGNPQEYPVRQQKRKPVKRWIHFFYLIEKKHTYLVKRTENSIWNNLYEPPNIESPKDDLSPSDLITELKSLGISPGKDKSDSIKKYYETNHALTHQKIKATFWIVNNPAISLQAKRDFIKVSFSDIHQYPIHRLFDKFLNYYNLHN